MEIIELSHGRTRATVIPAAGGRLHQLSLHDGRRWLQLLHSPRSPAEYVRDPLAGGSYPMVPWPGRIDGGRFLWRGRVHHVAGAGGHALHGRGVYLSWHVESRTSDTCRLSVEFDRGWPWRGCAIQEIRLLDDGIHQQIGVVASKYAQFPAGVGWHPWFRRRLRSASDARVLVDADQTYELAEMIPTGWLPHVKDDVDLRGYPVLGSRRIDACYRHPRGPLRIRWGDLELTLRSSANAGHTVVYTPREAVCIEPQSCPPDAFNLDAQGLSGVGVAVVDARHPLSATTTWRWKIGSGAR